MSAVDAYARVVALSPRATSLSLLTRLFAPALRLGGAIAREARVRRDAAILARMSDWQLKDIGMVRSEIGTRIRRDSSGT